jgi:hypothetical protein
MIAKLKLAGIVIVVVTSVVIQLFFMVVSYWILSLPHSYIDDTKDILSVFAVIEEQGEKAEKMKRDWDEFKQKPLPSSAEEWIPYAAEFAQLYAESADVCEFFAAWELQKRREQRAFKQANASLHDE